MPRGTWRPASLCSARHRGYNRPMTNATTPLWDRDQYTPGGGAARVRLFCFARRPLRDDPPLVAETYGIPSAEAIRDADVRTVAWGDDPTWFDAWRGGPLRAVAAHQIGLDHLALDEATYCHSIDIARDDPRDLGYLQGAWGIAQCLVDRGVTTILDLAAARWHRARDVRAWPAGRAFDVDREIWIVADGPLVHTRGLSKFGRPDLLVPDVEPAARDRAAMVLRSLATALAKGRVMRAGETATVGDSAMMRLLPYLPGIELPEVHLDNPGLVLADADGGPGIGGVLRSLQRH